MTAVPTAAALTRPAYHDHIVDVLIAERAPKLSGGPAWPLIRPLLYRLLDYDKARRMAEAIGPMPGRQALDHVSDLLSVKVTANGLDRIPRQGRLVIVGNHPTGIADGVAMYDALKPVRPDIAFYANADAHRVSPGLGDVLIPVEWVEAKRTREKTRHTLVLTKEALEAERALMIFPAGRLARRQPDGRYADPAWAPSAISIARKYGAPVVPIHVAGPFSRLFHLFDRFSGELRDITLFHELLNKQGQSFHLTVGPPVPPEALDGETGAVTLAVKDYVEQVLPADSDRPFA